MGLMGVAQPPHYLWIVIAKPLAVPFVDMQKLDNDAPEAKQAAFHGV